MNWEPPEFNYGELDEVTPQLDADDDFSINSDYLDVLPKTPGATVATSEGNIKDSCDIYEKGEFIDVDPAKETIDRKNDDEFAELDAWLTSGAVEIV